ADRPGPSGEQAAGGERRGENERRPAGTETSTDHHFPLIIPAEIIMGPGRTCLPFRVWKLEIFGYSSRDTSTKTPRSEPAPASQEPAQGDAGLGDVALGHLAGGHRVANGQGGDERRGRRHRGGPDP